MGNLRRQSQWASIYRFSNQLVVSPESPTTAGIRVAVEPFLIRVYENFSVLAVQLMSATYQKALCKTVLVPFFN